MISSVRPGGFVVLNAPSSGVVHRFPSDNWRFYSDAAYSFQKLAKKYNHHIHVIHTSTLSSGSTSNGFKDTNMIFWKEFSTTTASIQQYTDEVYVNSQDYADSTGSVAEANQMHLESLQTLFSSFQTNLISRLNEVAVLLDHDTTHCIPHQQDEGSEIEVPELLNTRYMTTNLTTDFIRYELLQPETVYSMIKFPPDYYRKTYVDLAIDISAFSGKPEGVWRCRVYFSCEEMSLKDIASLMGGLLVTYPFLAENRANIISLIGRVCGL